MSRHQRYWAKNGPKQESALHAKEDASRTLSSDRPRPGPLTGLAALPSRLWQAGNAAINHLMTEQRQGRPLDPKVRSRMEIAFNANFSDVRIHDDDAAATDTAKLGARAAAAGRHIYFARDAYAPDTTQGQRLLAHELAHVVQQSRRDGADASTSIGPSSDRLETQANQASEAVVSGRSVQVVTALKAPAVQRQATSPREQIIQLGESEDPADRQRALDLIVNTYYQRPPTLRHIEYDPGFHSPPHDVATGFARLGQPQIIKVGPGYFNRFRERFDQRARTIGHELQHVIQRSSPQRQGERTAGSTLLGIGAGILGGGLLGAAGLGIAALAGAALGPLAIGLALGGGALLGGLIGGLADPFRSKSQPGTDEDQQPIQNKHTREFLAIYWTVTAEVPGLRPLRRGMTIQNIRQPGSGALDQYRQMPREDQERYREQYEHLLRILRNLERSEENQGERSRQ